MEGRSRVSRKQPKRRIMWIVSIFAILMLSVGGYVWANREEPQVKVSPPKQETVTEKKVATKEETVADPEPVVNDEPDAEVIAEEPEAIEPELSDVEKYPEAIESVVRIGENMNAIYAAADELQQRFTPYETEDGIGRAEYVSRDELKDLFEYDANLSTEITSSVHFEAPDYTQEGFRQTREAHLIIIKELNELDALLEVYPGKFRQDPEGTLALAKGHFERIKAATQTDLPGFTEFFKTSPTEGS
ncbi:hypothetical protein [Exiguobacterium antarcticum]|uniref:hypothetical protein n=1 Tax=Exiguobacterium antarcticum TaxID=132920 RepID=UPI00047C68BF|nr:hypothetical protein [Exiguobacterium antarcticum]